MNTRYTDDEAAGLLDHALTVHGRVGRVVGYSRIEGEPVEVGWLLMVRWRNGGYSLIDKAALHVTPQAA